MKKLGLFSGYKIGIASSFALALFIFSTPTSSLYSATFSLFGSGIVQGGLPPGYYDAPKPPEGGFAVNLLGGETTRRSIVKLEFVVGDDTKYFKISNHPNFKNAFIQEVKGKFIWDICKDHQLCEFGEYIVYVKYYTSFTQVSSDVVMASIKYTDTIPLGLTKEEVKEYVELEPLEIVAIESLKSADIFFLDDRKSKDEHGDIFFLQKFLNDNGFITSTFGPGSVGKETSKFGFFTRASLTRFQQAFASEILEGVSSYFGHTFNIGELDAPTRTYINSLRKVPEESLFIFTDIHKGDRSDDVVNLQKILVNEDHIYTDGFITGFFGPTTERAVQLLQLKYGIVDSSSDRGYGHVGPATRGILFYLNTKE